MTLVNTEVKYLKVLKFHFYVALYTLISVTKMQSASHKVSKRFVVGKSTAIYTCKHVHIGMHFDLTSPRCGVESESVCQFQTGRSYRVISQ